MADGHKKGFNSELVLNDLENCCKEEGGCGQCQSEACTVGYAKLPLMALPKNQLYSPLCACF